MTIIASDVDLVLQYDRPITWVLPVAAGRAGTRDREHTNLFLREIMLRYPAGPPAALVTPSIHAINAAPVITPAVIRLGITNQEALLALPSTAPAAAPLAVGVGGAGVAARRAALLARMDGRRGAYTWHSGRNVDFTTWINLPAPLANPLANTVTLSCWEAVLVAAAEAGILTIAQLTAAYGANNYLAAFFNLFTQGGVQLVHGAHAPLANNIQPGDVLMIDYTGQALHHVMVAMTTNAADYRQTEVLSLWGAETGDILGRSLLDQVLRDGMTVRRSTL